MCNSIRIVFASLLAEMFIKLNTTVNRLSSETGIPVKTIDGWLYEGTLPSMKDLKKIKDFCKARNYSPDEILLAYSLKSHRQKDLKDSETEKTCLNCRYHHEIVGIDDFLVCRTKSVNGLVGRDFGGCIDWEEY